MSLLYGKILKGIGGFYYVKTESGIIECRARGKFRKNDFQPLVGDNVAVLLSSDDSGYVTEIFDRKNSFVRPPISNIDKLVIVSSVSTPQPDTLFIDKMLVTAMANGIEDVCLCFNKADENPVCAEELKKTYIRAGYRVFITSTINKVGVDELKEYISSGVVAVCGFSGVGKSSIVNAVTGKKLFEVGEVSSKLKRGKHTTRHVELIELGEETYLADTPGFSMLELDSGIEPDDLIKYFPDMVDYSGDCRFFDCNHIDIVDCGVCEAYRKGEISVSRYENYKYFYTKLKTTKEKKR